MMNIFFHEKPVNILIALKSNNNKNYGTKIAKEVGCTYSHCVKLLNELRKLELVEYGELTGRIKRVYLTKKGEEIANYFLLIRERLNE